MNNTVTLSEIEIDALNVDYKGAYFDFIQYDYNTVILMNFPLIKNWKFKTKYSLGWTIMSWIFPKEGEFFFMQEDIGLSFAFSMKKTDYGTIKPYVHFIKISLGKSILESNQKIF